MARAASSYLALSPGLDPQNTQMEFMETGITLDWISTADSTVGHVSARDGSVAVLAGFAALRALLRRREQAAIHPVVETLFFVAQLHKVVYSGALAFPLKLFVAY